MALANGASPATSAVTEGGARKIVGYGNPESSKSSKTQNQATRQLEILSIRSLELAERVAAGEVAFIDAVNLAYEAAVWAGLTEASGDDVVQTILAEAFCTVRRPQ
jgi:hypothetical protein